MNCIRVALRIFGHGSVYGLLVYYKGETFGECCNLFLPKLPEGAHRPKNIHGGRLNTKDGYGLGDIGL